MTRSHALGPETTFAVIGAGRLGTVLAPALRAAGFTVHGPLSRGETRRAYIALLAVPDTAIADAAAAARGFASRVGHLSGATSLDAVDFRIHPLQTFTGAEGPDVFHGIGAAVGGRTPAAERLATDIAIALGARPFPLDDARRGEYHAAASFASNFVLTVLDAAEQLAAASGIHHPRELLAPLVSQTVDNWRSAGATQALTGPIARGDEETVARQRAASASADLGDLFDALAAATRTIAARSAQHPPTDRETAA